VKVSDLSKEIVRTMFARLIEDGASNSKVRQTRASLRKVLYLAQERELVSSDPTSLLVGKKAPKAVRDEPRQLKAWSKSQVQQFLEHIQGDEFEVFCTVCLATGLRRGEILGLERQDVDLANQTISVRHQLCIVGTMPTFQPPKTQASKRTIAIGPNTAAMLKRHMADQAEARLSADRWNNERALVFCGLEGELIRPDHATKRIKRLVSEAGLEWIGLHGFRHTMASLALQNGTDIATVSQRLGHSNTHVTARIYLHGSAESDRSAALALDEILLKQARNRIHDQRDV